MKITVTNIITKKDNTLDIPITEDQLNRWLGGELIQDVMPELDLELREFLISGFLPGDFDKLFGPKKKIYEVNCIYCGCSIPKGKNHKVLDENFNDTGESECSDCWIKNMEDDCANL